MAFFEAHELAAGDSYRTVPGFHGLGLLSQADVHGGRLRLREKGTDQQTSEH